MKESQLRALIEAEIRSMLTEKFASKNMTKAFKRLDSKDKKMFGLLSNKYNIAWDKIDDKSVKLVKNPSTIKPESDTMILFFTNSDKLTGPEGDWDTMDVDKGLLAITHGKQSISLGNTVQTAKPGKATQAGSSGGVSKYFNSYKRIAQFADEAYVIYYSTAPSRNYVGNVQITRQQQKQGALALKSAKSIVTANRRRYDDMLKAKAAKLGLKGASNFMDKIYALFESEIKKKTELLKKGTWDTSWTTGYTIAKRAFESATELYERLLSDIERHKKDKEKDKDDWMGSYYKNRQAESIKAIKKQYMKLKKELSKHKPTMTTSESVDENKGLWANIRAKKARGEKPAKPGDKNYPDKKQWKRNTEDLDESKPNLASMMKMAAIATKKTKQSSSTAKAYLKSLARDLAKNARDYVDYDQDDWVEDLENWIADRG
jgi:hypothetical protein